MRFSKNLHSAKSALKITGRANKCPCEFHCLENSLRMFAITTKLFSLYRVKSEDVSRCLECLCWTDKITECGLEVIFKKHPAICGIVTS